MAKPLKQTAAPADRALTGFIQAVDRAYGNWWHLITRSFVSGLFVALGATVGFAILIAVISQVMRSLGVLPVIGEFFVGANEFLESVNNAPR